jgi:hypothetical protein
MCVFRLSQADAHSALSHVPVRIVLAGLVTKSHNLTWGDPRTYPYAPSRLGHALSAQIIALGNFLLPSTSRHGAVKHKKTSKTDFDIERPERPQSAPGPRGPPQGDPWGPYQPPRHPQEPTRSTNRILLRCHRIGLKIPTNDM